MLQRKHRTMTNLGLGLVVVLASTFMACSFDSPGALCTNCDFNHDGIKSEQELLYDRLDTAPLRNLKEADRWTVYEDPRKFLVQHGFGCAPGNVELDQSVVGFRIQDSATVLGAYNAGTIILNGWDVQYPNGDHHVRGLGTQIYNIRETSNADQYTLDWEAGGVLGDKNGDDGYKWCYRYTLVFWNRSTTTLDAAALQSPDVPMSQADESLLFMASAFSQGNTALLDLSGKVTVSNSKLGSPRAVVPRGFGMAWEADDHEVLQFGFDLGTPDLSGNTISWTSQTILKDDSTVHDYWAAELVSVLSGEDVEMWQPPTVLHLTSTFPHGQKEENELLLKPVGPGGCVGNGQEEHLEFYSVKDVPYEYAVPVLTGWNMEYACDNHHIERIGVYLVEFEYVKDPSATSGTLNYTIFSTMRDDSNNGHYDPKYQISVLGFNKLEQKN